MNSSSLIETIKKKTYNKTKSVLLLIAVIGLLIMFAFISSWWFSKQAINNIKITGNNILTISEVNQYIDSVIMGVPKDGINLDVVRAELLKNDYIADADVWFNSRGVLGINIKERIPEAIIIDGNGNTFFTDRNTVIFKERLNKELNNLPVISNCFYHNTNKVNQNALQSACNILDNIKNQTPMLYNLTSELVYLHRSRSFVLNLNDWDFPIYIGRENAMDEKLDNIYIFWKNNLLYTNNNYKYIDARWKDIIVVKNE